MVQISILKMTSLPEWLQTPSTISNTHTIQSTSPAILSMDQFDIRIRLVNIPNKLSLLPGQPITMSIPPGFSTDYEIIIKPNLSIMQFFCSPYHTGPKLTLLNREQIYQCHPTKKKPSHQYQNVHRSKESSSCLH